MAGPVSLLPRLADEQLAAIEPQVHANVSASAGTGKTQVLTARVLRLLLAGVAPETILCLTFTKGGAAEMSNRIGARLAAWVRMKDSLLGADLAAIGADPAPETRKRARQLFARVLDAPGGLRIQTIHSFAQTLLASFPAEAGMAPGFQPVEGRQEQELARRTLADLAADAEASGNEQLIADIQALSLRLGEEGAEGYLMACARDPEAMAALGAPDAIEPALRKVVGLPDGDIEQAIVAACVDGSIDEGILCELASANRNWGTKTGNDHADRIEVWLGGSSEERVATLDELASVFFTAKGDLRKVSTGLAKIAPDYEEKAAPVAQAIAELRVMQSAAELVALQAAGLRAGQAFAAANDKAKRAAGLVDFNDLIRNTRALLDTPGIADWVRYKMDQRTDHILVDEAQDTNADQWSIVSALIDDFFSGSSEAENRWRTLFMVGDFKQAIFSFQGTNPREYEEMRRRVQERADELEEAARDDPDIRTREFRDLSISASFRSAPAVLDVVDGLIRDLGHEALGLPERPDDHVAYHDKRYGRVEWQPAFDPGELDDEDPSLGDGEEGWIGEEDRAFASHLAKQVRDLIDEAPLLASTGQPLTPGDILILVRSRAEIASLIVARLFAERVPVAGIDRLHLHRPLAVQDLLAAITFAVQPHDDLNLAGLLVSPMVGWSQEQLYEIAFGRGKGKSLWRALREHKGEHIDEALAVLRALLEMADYRTPAQFLETILSGEIDGRRKLLARLGREARDPIEELVNAALDFERRETPSLDRFLDWFARGDVEVKRDPESSGSAVRVMTVHGAKGLEAPVVILADATVDPAQLGPRSAPINLPVGGQPVPLLRPRKAEAVAPFDMLIADGEARDLEEHWRLLYVALTRAEERLIVTGVKKRRDSEHSWHRAVEHALVGVGAEVGDDGCMTYETNADGIMRGRARRKLAVPEDLPDWIRQPAPPEARPPRPLSPSALGEEEVAYPPPTTGELTAARRGTLLHSLFERLPGLDPDQRREAALAWLKRSAGIEDERFCNELADHACETIANPALADLFAPGSLGEAPIAATLEDGRVVAGTVDRLLLTDDEVRIVDFKTGVHVPQNIDEVPTGHRRQMEAYRDALAVIFPGRNITASLLYTAGPQLISLPA